ncbi:MAG: glycerol dehydrogenase [Smithella sp.]
MIHEKNFDPNIVYQKKPKNNEPAELFISPGQYIQGAGVINMIGEYLAPSISGTAGIVITPGRDRVLGQALEKSLESAGLLSEKAIFQGESSDSEVERVVACFRSSGKNMNVIIGVGGGKCLDTARMAALELKVPVVNVPTTASTDAPTSAHSVVYDEDGVFDRLVFSPTSPLLVLVDLDVIADAPPRYLVAGMGDAYSTYFEARCCMENPSALTVRGARPTMAALAIAKQCRDLLLDYGAPALQELKSRSAGKALSRIVEANILLSGIGFESGGLAGAHAVAQGLTVCSDLHKNCLHGELVAIGIMTQLVMEKRLDEAKETAYFFKDVGLPLYLGQLGFDFQKRDSELDDIVRHSLDVFFIKNEPFEVTHDLLKSAIIEAGKLGASIL